MPLLLALLVAASLAYPSAPRGNVVDDYGGRRVPAPYRWMEDLDSPAVKQWVDAEDALTFSYLKAIPERDRIRERLTALWNYPRTEVPVREAGQLWYRRNAGLQKQSVPLSRAGRRGARSQRALARRIGGDEPVGSLARRALAGLFGGPRGSDVRDLRLRDLKTGKDTSEVVPRVKFSGISFTHDSRGFLYKRFKGTERSAAFAAANRFHQVWYHLIGGAQPDRLVFERAEDPQDGVGGEVSDDGRWLFLSSQSGTSNNRLWIEDLPNPGKPRFDRKPSVVSAEEDSIVTPLGVAGGRLYLLTTFAAQNGRIVSAAIGDPDRGHWKTVVAETKDPIRAALLVRDRLVAMRLVDVQSRLALYDLEGKPVAEVKLPEAGSVSNLSAKNGDPDFFFEFTSFLRPRTAYRYELKTGALTPFHPPDAPFDASKYETRALFYPSRDGTPRAHLRHRSGRALSSTAATRRSSTGTAASTSR